MKSEFLFSVVLVVTVILLATIFPRLSFADRFVCYDPVTKKSVVVAAPSLCPPKNILVKITDADLASLKNQQSDPQQKSLNTEAMALNCSPQTCKWFKSPMTSPTCEVKYCCCTKNLGICEITATRGCSSVQRFPSPGHGSVPK